jgi:23S rRNA (guanosine2251-2'-O)-methyltransferase
MNLVCGINPVLEALHAGERHFDRLIVVKGLRNQRISEAIARASRLGVPLRFESRETLDRIAGGVPHQGLIAVVSAKPAIDLETLLAQARQPALLVALDGVEDPRNLGAILRSCEAAGADGVLLPERHSAGLTETVARASAGALEHVKVARVGNLAQAIEGLKERGLWTVGFDASGARRWDAVDYKRPLALVLGGEGRGIRRLVRERCDEVVSIPLFGHVASLNVSVAAGVALYEVVRQRGAVPSHVRPIPPRAAPPPQRIVGPPPQDPEQDPGARPSSAADGEPPLEADADGDEAQLAYPINVVRHFEEDVAWGRPLETAMAQSGREGQREHRHGHGHGRPQPPPAAGGPADDAGRGRGRKRRRRGGNRHAPQDNRQGPPPAADAGNGGAQAAPEHPPQQPQNPGQGGPGGPGGHQRRGRRRRWRRRGGGPQPPQ